MLISLRVSLLLAEIRKYLNFHLKIVIFKSVYYRRKFTDTLGSIPYSRAVVIYIHFMQYHLESPTQKGMLLLLEKVPAQARMRHSVNIDITFKIVQTPQELRIPSVSVSVGHSGRMSRPLRRLQSVWFDYFCITSLSLFILYPDNMINNITTYDQ